MLMPGTSLARAASSGLLLRQMRILLIEYLARLARRCQRGDAALWDTAWDTGAPSCVIRLLSAPVLRPWLRRFAEPG